MKKQLWVVFARAGMQVVACTLFDDHAEAKAHYDDLVANHPDLQLEDGDKHSVSAYLARAEDETKGGND